MNWEKSRRIWTAGANQGRIVKNESLFGKSRGLASMLILVCAVFKMWGRQGAPHKEPWHFFLHAFNLLWVLHIKKIQIHKKWFRNMLERLDIFNCFLVILCHSFYCVFAKCLLIWYFTLPLINRDCDHISSSVSSRIMSRYEEVLFIILEHDTKYVKKNHTKKTRHIFLLSLVLLRNRDYNGQPAHCAIYSVAWGNSNVSVMDSLTHSTLAGLRGSVNIFIS